MPNALLLSYVAAALLTVTGASHRAVVVTTAYTPTEGKACVKVSKNSETGDGVVRCPGAAGYSLLVLNSDDRVSISIVTKEGLTLPLNFWDVVSPTFSTLGPKVEWQLASVTGKTRPVALIARVHTVDQSDVASPKPLSFLVIAQLRGGTACVTAKIPASEPGANRHARVLAKSHDRQCMPKLHPINFGP